VKNSTNKEPQVTKLGVDGVVKENVTDVTSESTCLLTQFLRDYTTPYFGGRSKHDIDILVFQLLIKNKQVDVQGSQQSISRALRIPISKVKSLIYETQLRDDWYDVKWFRNEVLKSLQSARICVSRYDQCIKLAIDNPMLRKELESVIKELNGLADYSFNSDILKIDFDIYALLIKKLITNQDEQLKLESAVRSAIKSEGKELMNWQQLVKELLKGVAGNIGEHVADLSFGYLTGGSNMLVSVINKLMH